MKRLIVMAVTTFALAGCTTMKPGDCSKTRALDDCQYVKQSKPQNLNVTEFRDIKAYGETIQRSIEEKIYNKRSYHGKSCTLKLDLARDGKLNGIKSEGGDPELCQAAIEAAKKAQFSAAPSEGVYSIFKIATVDFKL